MLDYWKSCLRHLSDTDLHALAIEAERRIGSHIAGSNAIDEYVQRQQALLELIQDELLMR